MTDEISIRKLARSNYWQNLYKSSKDCSGIHLFSNKTNFSGLQILFLHWLTVYDMLFNELRDKEWVYLNETVINDDVRTDAFLHYRGKELERMIRRNKLEQEKGRIKSKGKHTSAVTPFSVEMIRGE